MNATTYLFGEFNSGYVQYPDDYTSGIFCKFYENAKSITQLVIHRDGNLMYYGYIRKLEQEHYIGLCVVLNGLLLTRIDGLFSLFEKVISKLIISGQLIHFNEQGEIVSCVEKLYTSKEELDILDELLCVGFEKLESHLISLPATSYGIFKDSSREFVLDDDLEEIIKSTHTNGYTFIYKSKGFNTNQMNSYKGVLTRVNKEKKELQENLEKLQKVYAETLRQKKQYKYVFVLFVVLSGCAIGLFFLNDNLKMTRSALSRANNTISTQMDSLDVLHNNYKKLYDGHKELRQTYQKERERRVIVEKDLENLNKRILNRQPFIVKGTTFDFHSGYLKFDYYGISDTTVTINIRAYNENGTSYNVSSNIAIESGDNSTSVYVSRSLDSGKWYSFEILKGNVIIGGDRH